MEAFIGSPRTKTIQQTLADHSEVVQPWDDQPNTSTTHLQMIFRVFCRNKLFPWHAHLAPREVPLPSSVLYRSRQRHPPARQRGHGRTAPQPHPPSAKRGAKAKRVEASTRSGVFSGSLSRPLTFSSCLRCIGGHRQTAPRRARSRDTMLISADPHGGERSRTGHNHANFVRRRDRERDLMHPSGIDPETPSLRPGKARNSSPSTEFRHGGSADRHG